MDRATFTGWLDAYKDGWETRDPEAAADLFTADGRCTEFREWWHKRG